MTVTDPVPPEDSTAGEGSDFTRFAELIARDPAALTGAAYRQGLHLIQRYIRARFGGQQSQDGVDRRLRPGGSPDVRPTAIPILFAHHKLDRHCKIAAGVNVRTPHPVPAVITWNI